ncbi:DEAD/DEAH box helicase family protein [Heyndrickxia oleronia]|uniref:DEAD/DEAH box helicase family protein n=1 Tax=Heyndrickxia oleronia TaxID=38875 RepID=UPI003F236096
MRVSELVTIDEINKWNTGDVITISAGTGVGKSYFIKNNLYAIAKKNNQKILFLLHRTNCINQFKQEILRDKKDDIIHIKSYQHIEQVIKKKEEYNFSQYHYIVCDEFHYFLGDAGFNITTDMSLNAILKQTNTVRLFMSATGEQMKRIINGHMKIDTINYEIPLDFSFINSLTFYNKDTTLDIFLDEAIKTNEKAIYFIQSAQKAYEFYSKYKDYCLFNCSKDNQKYYQYVDQKKINNMLQNEKFEELILVTTTCFDTGVNIKDDQLKHIICDVFDTGTIIQCIGRKRLIKKDDTVNVYIKSLSNKSLGGHKRKLNNKLEMAKYLKEHGEREFIKEYPRELDFSRIIYDDHENGKLVKKINNLIYLKCLLDISEIDYMLKHKKYGYSKRILEKLGRSEYRVIEEEWEQDELTRYLNSLIGKKLYKEDQNELINKIDLKVNGKKQRSYRKLNEGLNMIKLPFIIIPKKSGSIRYWIVEKIDN